MLHLLSTCYSAGTVLATFNVLFFILTLITQSRYYYHDFIYEETEVQEEVSCCRSHG